MEKPNSLFFGVIAFTRPSSTCTSISMGSFTLSGLVDKPRSQVSSFPALGTVLGIFVGAKVWRVHDEVQ